MNIPTLSKFFIYIEIHCCFFNANLFYKFIQNSILNDLVPLHCIEKLGYLLHRLSSALSDERYTQKLRVDQKLFLYEDIKAIHHFIFNQDLINDVFSKCESHLIKKFKFKPCESTTSSEFQIYKDIMENILVSFNKANYLDKNTACIYKNLHHEYSSNIANNPNNQDHIAIGSDSRSNSQISSQTCLYIKKSFLRILKWFSLIYELKFIFGDLNSKIENLEFHGSL
ncbi:hypothetical protein RF11_15395 [Thelohanellus kitauei]|uniref:Uncharacterized protein n=1 Tax=Thelohanellus kitauei TaxID=669202 RepID=A0A0C2MMD8_THEKT|nr:hypothetical protein RF11_10728 [Thelohanellus kitauei]KII66389.1 hypothetical protein RF11_15395 [Thelohanellus kitauei]